MQCPSNPAHARAAAAPTCDGLKATIVGTQGRDVPTGTPRRDVIVGLGGNDRIDGRGSNNVGCGGRGADRLIGNTGHDQLYGGTDSYFSDRYRSDDVSDTLIPGSGEDSDYVPNLIRIDQAQRGVAVNLGQGTATRRQPTSRLPVPRPRRRAIRGRHRPSPGWR